MSNTPTLRFGEFDGEWKIEKLQDICEKISDGIHSTPKYKENENYYFVNGNNLVNGTIKINENTKTVDEEEYIKHKRPLGQNTILLSINGTIGNVAFFNNEKIVLGKSACYINVNNEKTNKYFINNILKTRQVQNFFYSEVTGSTIKNLSLGTIKNTKLHIPTLPEQQKIATFLSAIDSSIEQLSQKEQLFRTYKKGIMQKIFSQEIRFTPDEGGVFDDWVEKRFGDVYSFYTTNSYSRDNLNYEKGTVRNIHYGDIHTKFSTLFHLENEKVPFINEDIELNKIKDESYCQVGDLVIADASEDYADIGKTMEIMSLNSEKTLAGLHTFLARPNKYDMALGYTGYLLQSWKIRKQVMRIAQGTKVLSLSTKRLADVILPIPTKPEQTKIANFLSSLDKKIAQVSEQLAEKKDFKKGLLQKMFV